MRDSNPLQTLPTVLYPASNVPSKGTETCFAIVFSNAADPRHRYSIVEYQAKSFFDSSIFRFDEKKKLMSANRYQPLVTNLAEEIWKTIVPLSLPRRPWKIPRFFLFLSFFFFHSRGNNERWKSGIERATTYDNNEGGISIRAAFIAIRYATVQRNCGLSCDSKKTPGETLFEKKCLSINRINPSPKFQEEEMKPREIIHIRFTPPRRN